MSQAPQDAPADPVLPSAFNVIRDRHEDLKRPTGSAIDLIERLTASANDVPYLLECLAGGHTVLLELRDAHDALLKGVLESAPCCWDDASQDAEDIALAYVRRLETALRGGALRPFHHPECPGRCHSPNGCGPRCGH